MTRRSIVFLAVLFLAIAVSTSSAARWSKPEAFMKKMHGPIASTKSFTNRTTSAVRRSSLGLWKRIDASRKKLTSKASAAAGSKLINFADPLHAYPNALDKAFHRVFNRVALFEVNNADAVRSAINTARSLSLFSLIATAIGVALGVAIPVGAAAAGKRVDDEHVEYSDDNSQHWQQINHMAQMVLHAIQSGQLKYNV